MEVGRKKEELRIQNQPRHFNAEGAEIAERIGHEKHEKHKKDRNGIGSQKDNLN
jgi:hypothetical protein